MFTIIFRKPGGGTHQIGHHPLENQPIHFGREDGSLQKPFFEIGHSKCLNVGIVQIIFVCIDFYNPQIKNSYLKKVAIGVGLLASY